MSAILEAVQPETAEMIATQAKANGLSVDEYLKHLLGITNSNLSASNDSMDEFISAMESLAEENLKPLPRDFSREDIYFPAE